MSASEILRAPFPWFGGKSRCAHVVWQAFGNTPNYVEPFFGSGAVLLGRPHEPKIETVNDLDCYVANFFRAIQFNPLSVAEWCDDPVNEADLHARHRWLVNQAEFRERMKSDPDFYDEKIAGWWVWGLSQWIGGGWCASANVSERRPEVTDGGGGVHKRSHELDRKRPSVAAGHEGKGVHRKLPDLYTRGFGRGIRSAEPERGPSQKIPNLSSHSQRVAAKRPNVRNGAQGVHRREQPHISEQVPNLQGSGINASSRLPSLGNARGVHGADKPPCAEWFAALQARLRRVRVCCGDWTRVLGNSVIGTTKSRNSGMNPCGVFLDPPYSGEERAADLYGTDSGTVAKDAAKWAIEHGDDPDLRIALCGYEGEHAMPESWTCHAWKAHRGYAGDANDNKNRERIWFSPHCLPLEARQGSLFGEVGS